MSEPNFDDDEINALAIGRKYRWIFKRANDSTWQRIAALRDVKLNSSGQATWLRIGSDWFAWNEIVEFKSIDAKTFLRLVDAKKPRSIPD